MGRSIFDSIMPQQMPPQPQQSSQNMSGARQFTNPAQKAAYIMQAMTDPAAFVKQQFPDIPDNISNDPKAILSYLQQTRGINNQQIEQIKNAYPAEGVVK